MKRLAAVLFWSVLSAAFIGPGTVTTCAGAGARYGPALLWALLFSTAACIVLQEASARVTAVSGLDLGQALRRRSRSRVAGALTLGLVVGAVVLGCAAYEARNILGAAAGASLGLDVSPAVATVAIGSTAAALLWIAAVRTVARLLGGIVAVMGVAFLVTAIVLLPDPAELARGLVLPTLPAGSGLLVLGLVGTTVVPYNLFLGSGLARGQSLGEIRFGIVVAVALGGVISMSILVVGTAATGPFDFEALGRALAEGLGGWAGGLFAVGLFAAGLSSAMTAPLAAAVTCRSLFRDPDGNDPRWDESSPRFRGVWLGVLAVGIAVGLSGLKPIPVILLVQALNGILLPVAAAFLMIVVNDRALLRDGINGAPGNAAMGLTVVATVMLGTSAVLRAGASAVGADPPTEGMSSGVGAVVAAVAGAWLWRQVRAARGA